MLHRLIRTIITGILFISLAGCGLIYHQNISQGNLYSHYDASRIKTGMAPTEVTNIMGYPVLENVYPNKKLTYVYSLKKGHHDASTKSIIISFQNNRVTAVNQNPS